ncbi:hypothetical protein LTR78_000938 [Recurvomyces mirabilis]|uniref:Uncharacterized protein n=1 Tax=Recurvomyces mirabilis TaxID=574656 RepID=A0AAE0WWM4_9PEZI|nr:hypothetical protein LTR78_000938 [Recurvomyces mirabilis]KAK5158910.1 hypothetical protein LTS14_003018 [Recurvomyces mirabilis]
MATTSRPRRHWDDHLKHGQQLLRNLNSPMSVVEQSRFVGYGDLKKYGWRLVDDHALRYDNDDLHARFMPESMKQIFDKYDLSKDPRDNRRVSFANDRAVHVDGRYRPKTGGEFGNIYNPGLIIATYNYRPGFCQPGYDDTPLPKEDLTPLKYWSDVVFLQYQQQL